MSLNSWLAAEEAEAETAEHYCHRLEHQNDGAFTSKIVFWIAQAFATLTFVLGVMLCTSCFTCFCCCAREGWCACCATRFSEGLYHYWSDFLTLLGFGWCASVLPFTLHLKETWQSQRHRTRNMCLRNLFAA